MKDKDIIELEIEEGVIHVYTARALPIKIGDETIDEAGNAYQIADEEAVNVATKAKHFVLLPYIKPI